MLLKTILFAVLLFVVQIARAETCRLKGKEIDFSADDKRPGLEGEVTCVSNAGKPGEETDVYIYKNGLQIEWRRDTPQAKLVEHYAFREDRKLRHGARIDFYPRTAQIEE